MPGKNGIDAVIAIADKYPSLPVIIISSSEDPDDLRRAIDAGAMGYIAKTEDSIVILNAIKLVLSGGVYVSPSVIKKKSTSELASDNIISQLTPRQKEVLCCIVDGQSNKEIARSLQITDATIKVHLKTIFKILSVNNRTQAAMLAKNLGIQCD
jgi:DNA-binding NarL/FixJ family response regulator